MALSNGACVQVCSPNSVDSASCSVTNGSGTKSRTCNSSGSGFGNYGACVATSCNSGYTLSNGACVQVCSPNSVDSTSCSVTNGSGTKSRTCNSSGSGFGNYGACVATSCNSGYRLNSGACVAVPFPCLSQKTSAITAAANKIRNGVPSLKNILKANPPTLNEITKIIEARQQLVRDLVELEQDSSYPSEYLASLRNLIAALEYENSQALSPCRAQAVMNAGPGFWTFFAEGLWDAYTSKEGVHNMLGSAGMIPVAGCVFDLADSALYLYDGDNCMAAASLAFALPVVGDGASVGTKLAKGAQRVCTAIEPVCKTGVVAGRTAHPFQTAKKATEAAEALGYKKTTLIGKNGSPIYRRTNNADKNLPEFISPDWGSKNPGSEGWFSHNGGVWKGVNRDPRKLASCNTRTGTYNEDLTVWVGK